MPLIRIDVPEGTETEKKQIIHKKVREVVLRTLAPKQVKYDYVSIREAFGIIGDGLPVIEVDLRPGREPERKKGLVAVSYTHLRAHETSIDLVCRLLL